METLKFKSNIKCEGCLAKVTPLLDEAVGAENWSVDLQSATKTLTVKGNATADKIVAAVQGAGFKAEKE
ncbi:heavy-metal-associated domain-containing protein [Chitinophaga defluvii]|uniref:Cation transporter n=1 Tax=Chitinophaga defluvii TaxID=3163343 RepID=A0ABV2T0N2_9BACT